MKRSMTAMGAAATLFLTCAATGLAASALIAPAQAAEAVLPGLLGQTQVYDMTATGSGRQYRIYIAAPKAPPPEGGYPVVYTLDADLMFGTVTEAAAGLGRRPDVGLPVIVVGIGYPPDLNPGKERTLDYTPVVSTGTPNQMPGSGGASDFYDFIANDLKPEIARRFAVDSKRETLFGHSLGGLFTLYTLINHPDAFDTFVAASPSIWFENGFIKKENFRKRVGPKLEATGATPRVLITVGQYEQAGDPDFPPKSLSDLQSRTQVDNARSYAEYLSGFKGMTVGFREVDGLDHGTVIPAAITYGLRFAFSKTAVPPAPAPKNPPVNSSKIPVPSVQAYMAMTPEARYALRLKVRALPEAQRVAWVDLFDYTLSAGLTYDQHRRLHEERVRMDELHGTKAPD